MATKYANLNVTASKTAIRQQEHVCKNQKRPVNVAKEMMYVSMAKAVTENTGECGYTFSRFLPSLFSS